MFATIKNESLGTNINLKIESVFEKIGLNIRENQKLTELRDWLLPMLMNGQIKIKDAEHLSSEALAKDEYPDSYREAMAAEPEGVYHKKKQ